MSNFNNNYVGNINGGGVYLDTREPADDALLNLAASMGQEVGAGLPALAGNVIGNAVNYGFNSMLQDKQMKNQLELQRRAVRSNADAVRNQARLQVEGMKAAGLNPAGVNGSGAPSVQSGAAAGATSSMTNVFSGLAELVTALKAPTEIEKMQAETALGQAQIEKTQAETDLTHEQKYNLQLDSDLIKPAMYQDLSERVRSAKNANEVFEAHRDFVKEMGASVFDGYRGMLKQSGIYDKLSERTRQTIDSLADGEIDVGIGELQGLRDLIDAQANLSQRDRDVLENAIGSVTAINQANKKAVMDAYRDLPVNQRRLMDAQITEYYAMASQAKTQADLNKLNKWLQEHTSDTWLIEHGMADEIERKKFGQVLDNLLKLTDPQTYTLPFAAVAGGQAAGKARSSGSAPSGPGNYQGTNPATGLPWPNDPYKQSQYDLNEIYNRERSMRNGKNFR